MRGNGLSCGGCGGPIIGRIVSAMGQRWHPGCFRCSVCNELLEHVSSYEHEGKPYCHLDYHEFDLDDDVGFTVYKGHPYCEACHVRLRMPKCKRCKKSIRDGMRAVEALGGKWCWECFVCEGCEKPFDDPSFFLRDNKPFCEPCFSLIVRNEI
ncbi:LIM-domain-containing protein [Rhizopogon salebrosus TDB-379]|nr:LIM-domain-containing protein [Rhizopogon salebrosus TDB-379]